MRYALIVLVSLGCTTHNRVTLGPTLGSDGTKGGEITGELVGGESVLFVLAGTGRFGHDLTGGAIRLGLELDKAPTPIGVRGNVTLGPAFADDGQGGTDTKFEARGAFGVVYGFEAEAPGGGFSRNTLGLELFTSVISGGEVLFGLGLTFGVYHGYERSPMMAGSTNRAGFAGR
jgi:hypothetical protein